MRGIGLHLRWEHSFEDVLQKAIYYKLPFFQCFFIKSNSNQQIVVSDKDVLYFKRYYAHHFKHLYAHGSYWINLADDRRCHHPALNHEIALAKKLSFSHVVLHPGVYASDKRKIDGINALARSLNYLFKRESDIVIVLENTAHGNRSIGSDMYDFKILLDKMDKPEYVRFCIDTAHAFAYGYNIVSAEGREQFIELIESTVGCHNIALIHVNDSKTTCGSKIDCHAIIDQGYIKESALKQFVLHDRLKDIPIILELPVVSDIQEKLMLERVYSWHKS